MKLLNNELIEKKSIIAIPVKYYFLLLVISFGKLLSQSPANDNCINSTLISTMPSTVNGSFLNSTFDGLPFCYTSFAGQSGDLWYRVLGNGNKFGVSLCNTSYDTKLTVYTGACGAQTCLVYNDDNGPLCTGAAASATWCTTQSTFYYICISKYSSSVSGTSFTLVFTQTVNVTPTVNITASSPTICSGTTCTLTATGATSYTWQPTNQTGSSLSSTLSSTAIFTVTGKLGCATGTDTHTVAVFQTPSITVNSGNVCSGNNFTINPIGANTYTIQGGSAIVSPSTNTSYTVVGTSTAGCVSASFATSNVTVNPLPNLVAGSSNSVTCPGNQAFLSVNGANTYTWSTSQQLSVITISPNVTTIYTVTGTDINSCSNIATVTQSVNPSPTISVNSGTICSGNSFTIIPSGANTYTIQGGNSVISPSTNTSYMVSGTSVAGCVSASSATSNITVNSLPVVTAVSNAILICTGQSASLTASGASTYTWNTSATSGVIAISPTVTTTYTVTGTDANNCSNVATVTQSVDACTGIITSNEVQRAILNVYPNPSNGIFTIELTNESQITISNLLGQVVYKEFLPKGKSVIDLSNYQSGQYIIKTQGIIKPTAFKIIMQ